MQVTGSITVGFHSPAFWNAWTTLQFQRLDECVRDLRNAALLRDPSFIVQHDGEKVYLRWPDSIVPNLMHTVTCDLMVLGVCGGAWLMERIIEGNRYPKLA